MKLITPIEIIPQADRFALGGKVTLILSAGEHEAYCSVQVNLFSASGLFVRETWVGLTKTEADAWGEDDDALYDMVATKVGWTITGTVEEQPTEEPQG